MAALFTSPYPPYDPTDESGFSYQTVVKRWPVIITGVIDQLYRDCHDLSLESQKPDADTSTMENKIAEGKGIIEKISKLKYQMGRDHPLEHIRDDGEADVETYNKELGQLAELQKNTWFTAPWLFAEYVVPAPDEPSLASPYGPAAKDATSIAFFKMSTFSQSGTAIRQIATSMHELQSEKSALDAEKLAVLFREMVQMCLWGNATDLSLLTHMSPDDIEHLQSVGKEAQMARQQFILKDDQEQVWKHLSSLNAGRVDFVLDNSGFELFTDFVFADFLVTYTPYISRVYFHPKLIPWFVSDVTPPDFGQTITSLLDLSFFSASSGEEADSPRPSSEHLKSMVMRWKHYVDRGIFNLSVPLSTPLGGDGTAAEFWTAHFPYWNMKVQAPELFQNLRESDLVIFKGDLNYRKLTGDVKWPAWTPFESAIGPLAGSFPLLSLRTNKADVVVGVDEEVAEKLDKSGEQWRVDGRYALISFLGSK
ncbi:DUF89 domain-containing protein [Lyophyllum atratum]|nr:DUF89 domain-containing protein [Lyophyllum atratum]